MFKEKENILYLLLVGAGLYFAWQFRGFFKDFGAALDASGYNLTNNEYLMCQQAAQDIKVAIWGNIGIQIGEDEQRVIDALNRIAFPNKEANAAHAVSDAYRVLRGRGLASDVNKYLTDSERSNINLQVLKNLR